MERTSARQYSPTGPGTRFEHRLASLFLVRILTRSAVSELAGRAPDHFAFQQSSTVTIDDLVLTALGLDGQSAVRLDIAVRHAPKFVMGDAIAGELVRALIRSDLAAEGDSDRHTKRRLAVAVSGQRIDAQEVAELCAVARGRSSAEQFFEFINTSGQAATRDRLGHLRDMVTEALEQLEASDAGTPEHRCWSFLTRLEIIESELESEQEDEWTALVDDLTALVPDHSRASAIGLRDRLEQISAELAGCCGEIDRKTLRKRLRGEISPEESN